jgi:hypothetical protein
MISIAYVPRPLRRAAEAGATSDFRRSLVHAWQVISEASARLKAHGRHFPVRFGKRVDCSTEIGPCSYCSNVVH